MATYYEILKIQPTATTAEIEALLDTQYHEWRRLVTHHDPTVVNQANLALQTLEKIRATLIDPEKRTAYDAGLGLSHIDGLADPSAVLDMSRRSMVPSLPSDPQKAPVSERTDAWVCPKCQAPNSVNTQYCENCGNQVGVSCPSCNRLTRAAARFCSHCGADLHKAFQEKKAQDYAVEAERRRQQILSFQSQIARSQEEIAEYQSFRDRIVILNPAKHSVLERILTNQENTGRVKTINIISIGGVRGPLIIVAIWLSIYWITRFGLIESVPAILGAALLTIILISLETAIFKIVRTNPWVTVIAISALIMWAQSPQESEISFPLVLLSLLLYFFFWRGLGEVLIHKFVVKPGVISEITRLRTHIAELEQKIRQIQSAALSDNE